MDKLIQIVTVGAFAALLYFIIDEMMLLIADQVDFGTLAPNIKYYLCRLGIFEAMNIFISFLIASWFANKIINYLSN